MHFSTALISTAFFLSATISGYSNQTNEEQVSWNPRVPKKGQVVSSSEASPPPKPKKIKNSSHSDLSVGGSYTYAVIKPTSRPSFKGSLGGIQARYEYIKERSFYVGVPLSWKQGNTSGSTGSRFLNSIDFQERVGYTWGKKSKNRFFSLFTGAGYRHLSHTVKAYGNKVSFYYNEIYIPVGFSFKEKVNDITSLGLNFQWMPQVYPNVKIGPLPQARWVTAKKMMNFKGELPITVNLSRGPHLSIQIIPSFEYFQNGDTSAKAQTKSLHIPGNKNFFAGIDLNLGYVF